MDLDCSNKSKTGPGIKGVTNFLPVHLYPCSWCTSRLGQLMWRCWDEGTPRADVDGMVSKMNHEYY